MKIQWWIMVSSFPDFNWAKQTIYYNGTVDVLDCDGTVTKFDTIQESEWWLLEDEFERLETFDEEDALYYEISLSKLIPPKDDNFYIKNA